METHVETETREEISHTPGPWMVNKDNDQIGDVWAVNPNIPVAQAQMIGSLRFPDHKQREANTHLIAAAPELLAACKALIANTQHGDPGHIDYSQAVPMARKAIAKAEKRT